MFCIWMLIHQPWLRRLFSWTVLLPKICAPPPPYFAHYFEAKVGRGHLLEYSIHLVRIPFSVPHNLEYGQGWQSRQLLQKKQQLRWMCTADNQRRFCCNKDKRHWSNFHCQWWQGMTLCKLAFSVRVTKILAVVSERGYSNFVCACFLVQLTMGS